MDGRRDSSPIWRSEIIREIEEAVAKSSANPRPIHSQRNGRALSSEHLSETHEENR